MASKPSKKHSSATRIKRPTQFDVARLAGVSRATVSYVLNNQANGYVGITEETRQRVFRAAAELGYQPHAMAQSLRSGQTNMIGLLIPDMHNPFFWQIAYGVEQEVQTHGYDMLLMNAALNQERELHTVKTLGRRQVDGLILIITYFDYLETQIDQLVREQMPVVVLGNNTTAADNVVPTYNESALSAVQHLIDLGHRRIGMIHGVGGTKLGSDRLNAYRQGLINAGLAIDESLIEACGTGLEDGYLAASRLLSLDPRPTALVVINDLIAVGVIRAALDRQLSVPDDLSVVSFDNIEMAPYLNPPLTTVHIDSEEVGRMAARLIFQRLAQPTLPTQKVILHGQLVVRGSTSRAPH